MVALFAPGLASKDLPQLIIDFFADTEGFVVDDQTFSEFPMAHFMETIIGNIATQAREFANSKHTNDIYVVCGAIYGDGTATKSQSFHVEGDGPIYCAILIDVRILFETLTHLLLCPYSRYKHSLSRSVSFELLSLSSRLLATRDWEVQHIAAGLLGLAQQDFYDTKENELSDIHYNNIIASSFLDNSQIQRLTVGILSFMIFHEFGHFVIQRFDDVAKKMDENLQKFLDLQINNSAAQQFHDTENSALLDVLFPNEEKELIINQSSSVEELARIFKSRFRSRIDKEEFLADNFAVQNTAKILIDSCDMPSGEWDISRYAIQSLLHRSWSHKVGLQTIKTACSYWNLAAKVQADESKEEQMHRNVEELLEERKQLMLFQGVRTRFSLMHYDLAFSALFRSSLQSPIEEKQLAKAVYPSMQSTRIIHQFSTEYINKIEATAYSLGGLSLLSSRGRALQLACGARNGGLKPGDVFSFYLFGYAFNIA